MSCPEGASEGYGLRNRYAAVAGLAREGEAVSRFLARQGCRVVATDLRPPESFGDRLTSLAELGVQMVLGGHPQSVLDGCEVVFVSPGVPFDSPLLNEARARGLPLSTESRLFCHLCPAPIAAITGSSGKTTTTTLVGEMLKARHHAGTAVVPYLPPRGPCARLGDKGVGDSEVTWVGGNIGQPLIERLERIQADDRVVMELSSFQLHYFHPSVNAHAGAVHPAWLPLLGGWSPRVGAILNITPNHLDRHHSMGDYIHAKRAMVAYRRPWDVAVLGQDDPVTSAMADELFGDVRWFSRVSPVLQGACLSGTGREAVIMLRRHKSPAPARSDPGAAADALRPLPSREIAEQPVCRVREVQLRGEHNVANVLAACAIADAMGAPVAAMRLACTTFTGVDHRLEWVGDVDGVHYYNDSIATSPERLMAALRSFDEPIVLLAGGRDKHLPWDEAAQLMLNRTRHVMLFGEAAALIAGALAAARARGTVAQSGGLPPTPPGTTPWTAPVIHGCATLEDALSAAARVATAGDVVLLSPGCTSFDAFADFAERGARFRDLVHEMHANGAVPPLRR